MIYGGRFCECDPDECYSDTHQTVRRSLLHNSPRQNMLYNVHVYVRDQLKNLVCFISRGDFIMALKRAQQVPNRLNGF